MTILRKSILIALTAFSVGATTLAAHADEGRNGYAAKQEQMGAKFAAGMAKHQAKLHALLKLTAEQEPAWTTFVAAIAPTTPPVPHDRAAIAKLSALDRMAKMIDGMKLHTTAMEAHLAALKTFYAVLTPEQQSVFDANTMGGAHGPHHMMHHG